MAALFASTRPLNVRLVDLLATVDIAATTAATTALTVAPVVVAAAATAAVDMVIYALYKW